MEPSLTRRLIVALSIILIVAFVLISILNYTAAKKAITHEIIDASLPLLRENIYSEIQQDFLPSINISSMMASDSFLKNWALDGENNPDAVIQYLAEIKNRYGYKSTFFISSLSNTYYHYQGILKTVSPEDPHDVWYYRFLESGKEYDLDVDTDEARRDRLTIFVNYRLNDFAGNLLGVTGVGIEMEDFSRFLQQKQDKYQRRIYLVDHDGLVQAHSDPRLIENRTIAGTAGIDVVADQILRTVDEPVNIRYAGPEGDVLLSSRYIEEIDWFLIVEQDEQSALVSTRQNLLRTIIIGLAASLLIILISALTVNHYHGRLEALATTDSLTGCANRREMRARVGRMIYRYRRYGAAVSLIIIDLDRFKQLNDKRGHQVGDQVLKEVTTTIENGKRPDDLLARWGGDEFVVALEAGAGQARILAERIRYVFSQHWSENYPTGPRVSLSMGIAELKPDENLDDLIHRADLALYRAKRDGRDSIRIADSD